MDEKDVAAPPEAPSLEEAVTPDAATPAEPEPSPKPDPLALIQNLEGKISSLEQQRESITREFRTSQSTSDANSKKLTRQIERLSAQLESVATRGMDENELRSWKADRAVERATEAQAAQDQQAQQENAWKDFQTRGQQFLREEGISGTDERLTQAFTRYANGGYNWDTALTRAIADVHKDNARKAGEEAKVAGEKAREEERAKGRNEKRTTEGPTDRGGGPATGAPKDWSNASEKEVLEELERRKQHRIRASIS